jgi:hypothetical protein
MVDPSHTPLRSSGLRLLLRLVSVVAALFVLSVSGRASAASSPNPVVPMCGERNESVAAPPIFRAHDPGSIVQSPCQSEELRIGKTAPLSPERIVIQERAERVLGFASLHLAQSASLRLSVERAARALDRPGFVSALLRPPRA